MFTEKEKDLILLALNSLHNTLYYDKEQKKLAYNYENYFINTNELNDIANNLNKLNNLMDNINYKLI